MTSLDPLSLNQNHLDSYRIQGLACLQNVFESEWIDHLLAAWPTSGDQLPSLWIP